MEQPIISVEDEQRYTQLMDRADALTPKPSTRPVSGSEPARPAMQRSAGRPPRSQPGAETRSRGAQAEKNAFRDWMRTGTISEENRSLLRQAETRAMGTAAAGANATGGAVLIPTGFDPQLHSALKAYGELATAVRQLKTDTGDGIKIAFDDDTANGLVLQQELVPATEVDIPVSGAMSYVDNLSTGMVTVSNQLLNDSLFSVDEFITSKFGRRYASGLAKMIAQGNGSNIQKLAPGATITAAAGGANSITLDNLIALFGSLDPAYQENAFWVMTQATKVALMDLKDNYGHPILQPDVTGKPFNSIYGKSIVISQFTDNIGPGKTPILYGDLQQSYTLRSVGGLEIARSTDRYFELNATAYVGWARVGGFNTSQASSPSLVGFQNSAS